MTRGDASNEIEHAEFVTEATSKREAWGGAVCHPDAIIFPETCPANGIDRLSPGRPFLLKSLVTAAGALRQRERVVCCPASGRAGVTDSIAPNLLQVRRWMHLQVWEL
jgi:hypothetical protein